MYFNLMLCIVFLFVVACDTGQDLLEPVIDTVVTGEIKEKVVPEVAANSKVPYPDLDNIDPVDHRIALWNWRAAVWKAENHIDSHSPSRYTSVLYPVGDVEEYGSMVSDATALEWNGEELYMIAEKGTYPHHGLYLFTVDRETGRARTVNNGARGLGGTFTQGRNHVRYPNVTPRDMAWIEYPDWHRRENNHTTRGAMAFVCSVLGKIGFIDLDTGLVTTMMLKKAFCAEEFGLEESLTWGLTLTYIGKMRHNDNGAFSFYMTGDGVLYETYGGCVVPYLENPPVGFGIGEDSAHALCFDGESVYMVGGWNAPGFYKMNVETGEAMLIGEWVFDSPPGGWTRYTYDLPVQPEGEHFYNERLHLVTGKNITGLAFDGENMYAVCDRTDALFRLGKR